MPNLVCVGNISRDSVRYGSVAKPTFYGGAGLNVAVGAAYAGLRPFLLSVLGQRDVSILEPLGRHMETGIQVIQGDTAEFSMEYDIHGNLVSIASAFGVAAELTIHTLSFLDGCDATELAKTHLHLSCRSPLDAEQILSACGNKIRSFSLDFVSSSAADQTQRLETWLPKASCLFANSTEFATLRSLISTNILSRVVVTDGGSPVKVMRFGETVSETPCPRSSFEDVTGAGDVFAGAFLAGLVASADDLTCTAMAIRAAQESLRSLGVLHLIVPGCVPKN